MFAIRAISEASTGKCSRTCSCRLTFVFLGIGTLLVAVFFAFGSSSEKSLVDERVANEGCEILGDFLKFAAIRRAFIDSAISWGFMKKFGIDVLSGPLEVRNY